jgi:hypothetical protein
MITVEDVREFGHRWFDTVGRGGSAEDQAALFLDKHARIYIVWNGVTFSLEEHHKLHTQWINERHQFGQFSLTPLSPSPERVRADWQAPGAQCDQGSGRRRLDSRTDKIGKLAFVIYMNTFHHTLPDSAPLKL